MHEGVRLVDIFRGKRIASVIIVSNVATHGSLDNKTSLCSKVGISSRGGKPLVLVPVQWLNQCTAVRIEEVSVTVEAG